MESRQCRLQSRFVIFASVLQRAASGTLRESKVRRETVSLWRQLGADIEGDFGTCAEFPVSLSGDGMEVAIGIVPESDDKALAIDENSSASVVKVRVLRFVETRVGSVDYKVTGTSQVCDGSDTKNAGFFEGVSIGPFDSADKLRVGSAGFTTVFGITQSRRPRTAFASTGKALRTRLLARGHSTRYSRRRGRWWDPI